MSRIIKNRITIGTTVTFHSLGGGGGTGGGNGAPTELALSDCGKFTLKFGGKFSENLEGSILKRTPETVLLHFPPQHPGSHGYTRPF